MATRYDIDTRGVNAVDAPIPVRRVERINVEALAGPPDEIPSRRKPGIIPTTGIYSVVEWADAFGIDERTFQRWVRLFRIPHFKPGHGMYVRAEDLLPRLPYVTWPDGDDGREE